LSLLKVLITRFAFLPKLEFVSYIGKRDDIEELFEFRIEFRHIGSDFPSTRYFTCLSAEAAREMFLFACRKDDIEAEIVSMEVWNRWADRWEIPAELVENDAELVS
jgi:hypothetical protein